MKLHCKQIFSLLLSLLLAASFVWLTASAEDSGYAAGDIIEYGSYPQSLVTDAQLLAVLPRLPGEEKTFDYYGEEVGTGTQVGQYLPFEGMRYIDVVYGGVKYRGVALDAYRPFTTPAGQAESAQAINGYPAGQTYWFRFEPLRWRVLDPQSGFVLSEALIDCQPYAIFRDAVYAAGAYTGEYGSTTDSSHTGWWQTVSEWLNRDFYETAFSAAQQANICAGEQVNDYWYYGNGVNGAHRYDAPATQDKIFLPAWDELTDAAAGFSGAAAADPARVKLSTDYAKLQGIETASGSAEDASGWLMRTSCRYYTVKPCAGIVDAAGKCVKFNNVSDRYCRYGVCPAMKLDRLVSDATGDDLLHPGDLVSFGNYPKSRLTDADVIGALNGRLPSAPQKSLLVTQYRSFFDADYHTDYADLIVDGKKYRAKIEYTDMIREYTGSQTVNVPTPKTYTGYDFSYTDGGVEKYVYYYAFEPLVWRVLDPENGLMMCSDIVETLVFQPGLVYDDFWDDDGWTDETRTHYATDYTVSRVREFLNDDFLAAAFTDGQRANIQTTGLDNRGRKTLDGESGFERYDWASTADKVFLLSSAEALNAEYGFTDETRILHFTEYALENRNANDNYWLLRNSADLFFGRRPGGVTPAGHVTCTAAWSNDPQGVAPAIRVAEIINEPWDGTVICETHVPVIVPVTPATCQAPGVGNEICAVCGALLAENVAIPTADHTPGEPVETVTRAATCSEPGEKTVRVECAVCRETLSETTEETALDAANHADYGTDVVNAVPAVCYRDGYTGDTVCARCRAVLTAGETVSKDTVSHTWDEGTVTVKPTCSATGTALYRCTVKSCSATMEKELPTDPEAHVFRVTVTEPTCTEAGYTTHACTLCRYGYTDNETPALGHSYGIRVTPATCTSGGITTYTCTRCRHSYTKNPTPPVDHVDADGDGWCDFGCGTAMGKPDEGGHQDNGQGKCPYCGQTHTGFFGGIVAFFHRIAYFFRQLFGR